ncbi:uncharacterized protein LOC132730606 [Ruditapes philippinarum]|uniref:uncharacterized protein LOC132730606 n=1 Tax=Ruditapes philippinarum TaxID=129788 RepID=UPI00295A9668|nr:uncharacterized protein LOC132730606 [Ruditapes philippinarum]
MSNSWLCTRTKVLQICQIRNLTNTSWFQNRSNTLSVGLGGNVANVQDQSCLINSDNSLFSVQHLKFHYPFLEGKGHKPQLQCIEGNSEKLVGLNSVSKYDVFTYLRPFYSRNQDLLKCLARVVEPAKFNDTIHVTGAENSLSQSTREIKTRFNSDNHALESFDAFSAIEHEVNKDFSNSLHMSLPQGTVKAEEKDTYMNSSMSNNKNDDTEGDSNRPSLEQLETVKEYYIEQVPKMPTQTENFSSGLHHHEIVFENNFFKKPKVTMGLAKYSLQLTYMKCVAAIMFPRVELEIQSILSNYEEGCVKMHWRMYMFTTLDFFKYWIPFVKEGEKKSIDAISTFYLNKDGLITLHRLDRRLPISKPNKNPVAKMAGKTAQMLGLAPKSSCKESSKEHSNLRTG